MINYPWRDVNPCVDFVDTRKKFFNKFCYAAVYKCPGGRIIRLAKSVDDIGPMAQRRYDSDQLMAKHSIWNRDHYLNPGDIDQQQILAFFDIKHNKSSNICVRIEEPFVRVYGETEQELYELANNELAQWRSKLLELHRPADAVSKAALDCGSIVMKNHNGYRYKFILRDGCYMEENKLALANYLDQLGDLVKVSKTVRLSLNRDSKYMWRAWFYSNDYHIKTMIDIIAPGAVSNIHEVTSSK
jgi:hypothetical protein